MEILFSFVRLCHPMRLVFTRRNGRWVKTYDALHRSSFYNYYPCNKKPKSITLRKTAYRKQVVGATPACEEIDDTSESANILNHRWTVTTWPQNVFMTFLENKGSFWC
eukprot:scaffold143_cov364-Pavlova_lutheri.AAC.10